MAVKLDISEKATGFAHRNEGCIVNCYSRFSGQCPTILQGVSKTRVIEPGST